jgi:hypothetical protein
MDSLSLDAQVMKLSTRIWLTTFFAFGTIMWYETINGGSWQVSMLVAVLMTLLALNEVFGNARPWLVGLFAAGAFLSRYDLLLTWPFYFLLVVYRRPTVRWTSALPICYGFALAAIIYIAFNEARWGTLTDQGLWRYDPANGNLPLTTPPTLFAWRYFPGNFFTLFYMAPRLDATFPYIHPLPGGQSILTTSPAFLLALRAKFWRKKDVICDQCSPVFRRGVRGRMRGVLAQLPRASGDVIAVAAMAILSALPVLLYVGNGMTQFGTRHFVEVFPFLTVLMAMGGELDQMGKVLIVTSVALIALGILSIRWYGL